MDGTDDCFSWPNTTIDLSMFKLLAVLLSTIAFVCSARCADPSSIVAIENDLGQRLTSQEISTSAAANSVAANLIQSEVRALSASIDRDEPTQLAQLCYAQRVLDELACHERQRAVAQALSLYHQLVALDQQKPLLAESLQIIDQLLRFAEKANELGIKDGNQSQLEDQRLQVLDQQLSADGNITKLRIALAELTAKPIDEMLAIPITPPSESILELESASYSASLEQSIQSAMLHRCDLKAIDSLCRSLSESNLATAKQLLGTIQSGLGLAFAATPRLAVLSALHHSDTTACELRQRRQQCQSLRESRRSQIETQVRIAHVELQTATQRRELAQHPLSNADRAAQQARKAIELDQAQPGSDLLADLDRLQVQARYIERQSAVSLARVKLDEARGTLDKH
jgi:hypothetical protein